MRFSPKTEEDINSYGLLEPGVYDFEVVEARDRISKSGNDMIELKLKFWDKSGDVKIVFDYLLEAMAFKLRHFCSVTGLIRKYEEGNLQAMDCIGRCGKAEIIIQPGNDKPGGGYYPDKNAVKDYINSDKYAKPLAKESNSNLNLDQDVPF